MNFRDLVLPELDTNFCISICINILVLSVLLGIDLLVELIISFKYQLFVSNFWVFL